MHIQAVIFDLDGVIVKTDELHYRAWKKITDQEGIYFDKQINNRLRGVSRIKSLSILLERADRNYTTKEQANLAAKKNAYYVELLNSLSPKDILPQVMTVIKKLRSMDIKLAIGSSSKNAKTILKHLELLDTFDALADGNDIKHSKPHPDVFLVAAHKLKVDPRYCMVIEDAVVGIKAAKSIGMYAVAIGAATVSNRADFKISCISELVELLAD